VSILVIGISSFAYPLVVLDETGSPARAGLVGSVLAGTAFFLRLPAGVLVDRWNRRAILIACDLGRALNAGAFAIAPAFGHFSFVQRPLRKTRAARRSPASSSRRSGALLGAGRALPSAGGVIGALGGIAFLLGPAVNAIAFAAIAEGAPDELQGRVTSAGIQLASLGAPVGLLLAGVLLGAPGPSRAIVVYGCALLALAIVASVSRGLRA
jgi:MFS family permease